MAIKYNAILILSNIEQRSEDPDPVNSKAWLLANLNNAATIPIMQSFSSQFPPFLEFLPNYDINNNTD